MTVLRVCALLLVAAWCTGVPAYAGEYVVGKIVTVEFAESSEVGEVPMQEVRAEVLLLNGAEKGEVVSVRQSDLSVAAEKRFQEGGMVVLDSQEVQSSEDTPYYMYEPFRLPIVVLAGVLFCGVVLISLGVWGGLRALAGLFLNGVAVLGVILPLLLMGYPAVPVVGVTATVTAAVTIVVSRGWGKAMRIAVGTTMLSLLGAVGMSMLAMYVMRLSGLSSEDAFTVQLLGGDTTLDPRGLLLSGIIIGTLGVLDDVTTAQAQLGEEMAAANPDMRRGELFASGMRVGRTHIAGMVNTLVLAYAGAALPLLVLLHVSELPLWIVLNSEMLAEEVVRSLVGALALVLAVPLTAWVAAVVYGRK